MVWSCAYCHPFAPTQCFSLHHALTAPVSPVSNYWQKHLSRAQSRLRNSNHFRNFPSNMKQGMMPMLRVGWVCGLVQHISAFYLWGIGGKDSIFSPFPHEWEPTWHCKQFACDLNRLRNKTLNSLEALSSSLKCWPSLSDVFFLLQLLVCLLLLSISHLDSSLCEGRNLWPAISSNIFDRANQEKMGVAINPE